MKFQPDKFDKIIFDMDGVITSEYIYWDTAALTVYELLYDYRLYGKSEIDRDWCYNNCKELRRIIFCGDKTIRAVKNLGVNTNWDLAYIVFCVSKYIDPELTALDEWHFESVRMFIENITARAPEVYDLTGELASVSMSGRSADFKRGGEVLWSRLVDRFQRWFLGSCGIDGMNKKETPLIPVEKVSEVLEYLKNKNIKLGIGTGRPRAEIIYPLEKWDLLKYFDYDMIVTYDEVSAAENTLNPELPISKPHPFVFLKAAFGGEYSDERILNNEFDKNSLKRAAVVGDAPSDLLAAKAAGMPFIGVLTGVDKSAAEKYFTRNNADYILDDITKMM